jgi:hypothetical protein
MRQFVGMGLILMFGTYFLNPFGLPLCVRVFIYNKTLEIRYLVHEPINLGLSLC